MPISELVQGWPFQQITCVYIILDAPLGMIYVSNYYKCQTICMNPWTVHQNWYAHPQVPILMHTPQCRKAHQGSASVESIVEW